jgi:hypothetical protein
MTSRRRSAPWQRLQHRRSSSLSSPHFTPARAQIAQLAIQHRMPTMFIFRTYVEAGGLLSYCADFPAMHRQAATHVAQGSQGRRHSDRAAEQI